MKKSEAREGMELKLSKAAVCRVSFSQGNEKTVLFAVHGVPQVQNQTPWHYGIHMQIISSSSPEAESICSAGGCLSSLHVNLTALQQQCCRGERARNDSRALCTISVKSLFLSSGFWMLFWAQRLHALSFGNQFFELQVMTKSEGLMCRWAEMRSLRRGQLCHRKRNNQSRLAHHVSCLLTKAKSQI